MTNGARLKAADGLAMRMLAEPARDYDGGWSSRRPRWSCSAAGNWYVPRPPARVLPPADLETVPQPTGG